MANALIAWVALAALATAAPAFAAKPGKKVRRSDLLTVAEERLIAGARLHNAGRYDEAILEFQEGYRFFPEPRLTYNIGQSHYAKGSLAEAARFYRRYLHLAPKAENRRFVEGRIAEIDAELKKRSAVASEATATEVSGVAPPSPATASLDNPPRRSANPDGGGAQPTGSLSPTAAAGQLPASPPAQRVAGTPSETITLRTPTATATEPQSPVRFRLLLGAGISQPKLSQAQSKTTPYSDTAALLFSTALTATYLIPVGEAKTLDLGVSTSWSPLHYKKLASEGGARSGDAIRSDLLGLFATAVLRFSLSDTWSLGPSLGLGAVWWAGLEDRNPFSSNGQRATAPVPMPAARASLASLWSIGARYYVGVEAGASVCRPMDEALSREIALLTRIEASAMFGVGF